MSKICKYAGDPADEYCKNCDGIIMEVDDKKIDCTECAGYEADEDEAGTNEEIMNPPVEEAEDTPVEEPTNNEEKSTKKTVESKKANNSTPAKATAKSTAKNKATTNKTEDKVVKVKEETKALETVTQTDNGIKVVSMRYTSGATVKKGDNYFKFVAEEEWDVSQVQQDIQDIREQLWATLNSEVDKQIEELNSMN